MRKTCRVRPAPAWLIPVLALPLLAGCAGDAPPLTGEALAHEQTVSACRQRADQAYDITHRGDIYAAESGVNTPFSANYQPGVPDRGLSARFQHDEMVQDCIRNTGADSSRTPQLPPNAAAPQPAPPPPRS